VHLLSRSGSTALKTFYPFESGVGLVIVEVQMDVDSVLDAPL
jgi:hypothetical protein